MFKDSVVRALADAAKAHAIEPAALLAIAEVETAGATLEADGRTPQLLYERHVAYREAKKKSSTLLARFVAGGLAIPKWNKATQYRDERNSAQRLELIARAKAVDPEVACRSASWGIGQTMGFLAEELGFPNAVTMIERMTDGGVPAQIECMIGELKNKKLIEPLNRHEWAHVARIYNGASYAQNQYDVKLEAAWRRWARKLAAPVAAPAPEAALSKAEIESLQGELRALGYAEVGTPDGKWASKTTGAIAAFQSHEGLPISGHYDAATRDALAAAQPREPAPERATATVEDLKAEGSRTVVAADQVGTLGKIKMWLFGALGIGGASEQVGLLDQAKDIADKGSTLREVISSAQDLLAPLLTPQVMLLSAALCLVGFLVWRHGKKIKAYRLEDHVTGVHAGPAEA